VWALTNLQILFIMQHFGSWGHEPRRGISVLEPVFTEMELLSSNTVAIEKIAQLNRRIQFVFNQARAEMEAEQ